MGKTATVKIALNPEGTVMYKGEIWAAESQEEERVKAGEEVIITGQDGLKLYVARKTKQSKEPA